MRFGLGVVVLGALYAAQHFIYPLLGEGLAGFFVPMGFFFLNLHIIFCVFGKRLHDLGRSFWPLIGLFVALILVAIFAMLAFGGLDYFDTLYQNPELSQNAEAMQAVHQTYQNNLATNMPRINLILALLPVIFTAWLFMTPGQPDENRYGLVPKN